MTFIRRTNNARNKVQPAGPLGGIATATQSDQAVNLAQMEAAIDAIQDGDTFTGPIVSTDTTQSTTKDTGAIITEGGVGIEKNLFVGGTINGKKTVTDTGGAYATPIVLTSAQSGAVILVDDAAGLDFTLPAIGANDIGMKFEFLVTVTITSNNFRVTAAAGDLLNGGVWMVDFDAAYTAPQGVFLEPDFSDDLVMTMNGGTTGGKKGTKVEFIAVSATQWFVTGTVAGDGVLATPFS